MKVEFHNFSDGDDNDKFGFIITSENLAESIAIRHVLETPVKDICMVYDHSAGMVKE